MLTAMPTIIRTDISTMNTRTEVLPAESTLVPDDALLYLLQVATPAFPTGAFSHSWGFETLIDERVIDGPESLEREALRWLRHGVARADGAGVAQAYRAARDVDALRDIDGVLGALKLGRETREGSLSTGRAFIDAVVDAYPGAHIGRYAQAIDDGVCLGHYATAFGVASADAGIPLREAVLAFLHGSFANMVSVAARIIPLGQLAVQRMLSGARARIGECTDVALATPMGTMGSATVRLDVASMAHERLYTRLCIS
jgi:urease accessory protein